MTSYLALYILINVFCTVLVVIFALHSRIGMGAMVAQRRFAAAMYTLVVFFLSDTLWYAMDCGALPQIWIASMVLKTIYFLSATVAGFIWFYYMASLTKATIFDSSLVRVLVLVPLLVHVVLCLVNFFTPLLFGVDETFTYFRGPLFGTQYVFIYLYLVVASIHAVYKASRPENYIDRSRYIIISLFPVLPAISGLLQLFYWRMPFNCTAFAMGVVIVYLTELSEQISQEPLTQLANRKQLMRVLEQNMNAREADGQLFLFMMDMDRFKVVNDTFGHVEGDRAIAMVGDALKQAVRGLRRRPALARYGGDEFAVVVRLDSATEADALKQRIIEEIEVQNTHIDKDYRLALSVGIARYNPDEHRTMRDFIAAADTELYKEKHRAREREAGLL